MIVDTLEVNLIFIKFHTFFTLIPKFPTATKLAKFSLIVSVKLIYKLLGSWGIALHFYNEI